MNFSVSGSFFVIFSIVLINLRLASGSGTKQSDSGVLFSSITSGANANEEWRNEDIREKQIIEGDATAYVIRERQWRPEVNENRKKTYELRTDLEDEIGDGSWVEGNHDLLPRKKFLHLNETTTIVHEKRDKHRPQFKSESARHNRRRHRRKLDEEIESLHDEISHVVANLDEMAKKETELQQEVDELRKLSHIKELQSKHSVRKAENDKRRIEILLPQTENGKHHSIHGEIKRKFPEPQTEGAIDTSDFSEEDNKLDLMENLEDQDFVNGRNLREEVKVLRKKIGELLSKNRELRGNNKELRRQLCKSMAQQDGFNTAHENGELNRKLGTMSRETGGNLQEDTLPYKCRKFFHEKEMEYHKKENPHPSSSHFVSRNGNKIEGGPKETEFARGEETGSGAKAKGIKRRNENRRQFPKSPSQTKGKKYRRKTDNQDAEGLNVQKPEEQNGLKTRVGSRKQGEGNLKHRNVDEKEINLFDYMLERESAEQKRDPTDYDNEGKSEGGSESWFSSSRMSNDNGNKRSDIFSKQLQNKEAVVSTATNGSDFGRIENSEIRLDETLPEEDNITISTDEEDKEKVYDHIASVDDATFCGKPQPMVIYPADEYPVPNKYYTPQGTILHRCGNHSGCCPSEQLTCVPAKKEKVVLHFFAAVLDGSSSVVPHVEKLRFTNHTKCGCVFKNHAHFYL